MKTIATITIGRDIVKNLIDQNRKNILEWIEGIEDIHIREKTMSDFQSGRVVGDIWEKYSFGSGYCYQCTPKLFHAYGTTCSNQEFHILFSLRDRRITVIHEGLRGSYPGNMKYILPQDLRDSALWSLDEYKTSRPDYAPINGFLDGSFGISGPRNMHHEQDMEHLKIKAKIDDIISICGLSMDTDTYNQYTTDNTSIKLLVKIVRSMLSGTHYRRLAAMGISF